LCSVLDGCSRFLVHWDLRESMKEADIEMILELQRFRELIRVCFPEVTHFTSNQACN